MLFGSTPSYAHLKVFGCLCYAHVHDHIRDKFDEWSTKCIFMGYPYGAKHRRVYDIERKENFISDDVVFYEIFFPYRQMVNSTVDIMDNFCSQPIPHESPSDMQFSSGPLNPPFECNTYINHSDLVAQTRVTLAPRSVSLTPTPAICVPNPTQPLFPNGLTNSCTAGQLIASCEGEPMSSIVTVCTGAPYGDVWGNSIPILRSKGSIITMNPSGHISAQP